MTLDRAVTVESLERLHPEWSAWLRLASTARGAAADPVWGAAVPAMPAGDGESAPLIAGAVFTVDARSAARLFTALLGPPHRATVSPDDAVRVLDAAVAQDDAALRAIAERAAIDGDLLAGVAPLIALPLLQACGRAWSGRIPPAWRRGTCPVCGAWAAVTEARGVERSLRLRCARCGADWGTEPVRCFFCAERDHQNLRALVGGAKGDTRRIEVCATCRGYMKTVTTLTACPALDVGLLDLATVDLDLAAVEHGYARPASAGRPPGTRVIAHGVRRPHMQVGRR